MRREEINKVQCLSSGRAARRRKAPDGPANWMRTIAAWNANNTRQVPEFLHRPFYVDLLTLEDWATAFTRRGEFALRVGNGDCETLHSTFLMIRLPFWSYLAVQRPSQRPSFRLRMLPLPNSCAHGTIFRMAFLPALQCNF